MDIHGAVAAALAEHEYQIPESGERYEKSELQFFVEEDKTAGQNIGILLAVVFLVSFVLMSGVCYWMLTNAHQGDDPQAGIGEEAVGDHR